MPFAATALPLLLGAAHLLVDASSNFVMMQVLGPSDPADVVGILVAYNLAAFALQPAAGLLVDRLRRPRAAMCLGILLAAAALLVSDLPAWLPVGLTGLGNALFHVGGGTLASRATPGRAAGPGLFIAPGAVGVALGTLAGRTLPGASGPLFVALLAFAIAGGLVPAREPDRPASPSPAAAPAGSGVLLALLLAAIALRSFLGARVAATLGIQEGWVLPLAVAAFTGKALGGVVADRLGWTRTAVVALLLSSALLALADRGPALAALAMVFFQAVTAVTLGALYRVLPGRTATAFGLASLAYLAGGFPLLVRVDLSALDGVPLNALVALASVAAVWHALAHLPPDEAPRPVPAAAPPP